MVQNTDHGLHSITHICVVFGNVSKTTPTLPKSKLIGFSNSNYVIIHVLPPFPKLPGVPCLSLSGSDGDDMGLHHAISNITEIRKQKKIKIKKNHA